MVDEFSNFARMPVAVMQIENLTEICHQAMFLQKSHNADIAYRLNLPNHSIKISCDGRQISQILLNLLKNADDAVSGEKNANTPDQDTKNKQISLALYESKEKMPSN